MELQSNEQIVQNVEVTAVEESMAEGGIVEAIMAEEAAIESNTESSLAAETGSSRKKKSILLGSCVAVVAAVIALAVFLGGTHRTPAEMFVYVQKRALIDAITQVLTDVAQTNDDAAGFSDDITFFMEEQGIEMEMVVKAEVEPDWKSGVCSISYGTRGIRIDFATLTFDEEQIGFQIPLLNDNYYVLQWESFHQLMGEMMPEAQEMDWELFSWKQELTQIAALWPKYSDILLSVVRDENVTEETVTLLINGQQKTCTLYTFQPTAQDLEAMFTELLTALKADDDVKALIWNMMEMTWEDGEQAGQPLTLEEYQESYDMAMEEALASVAELAQEIAGDQCSWAVAVDQEKIYQQRLEEKGQIVFLYETTNDDASQRYDALIFNPGQEEEQSVISTMTVQGSRYTGQVQFVDSYGEYGVWDFDWDLEDRSSIGVPIGSFYGVVDEEMWSITAERNEDGGVDHWVETDYMGEYVWMRITTAEQESTVEAPDTAPVDLSAYSWEELQKLLPMMGNGMTGDEYY